MLPQVGEAGQAALTRARVLLVGCGALGTHLADQLVRAGVGFLRIADRDVVEWTNLQRQVLFDEEDARRGWPKAAAAAERLARVNSEVTVEPRVADVDSANVEMLAGAGVDGKQVDLIVDGTDNVETRYLLNDVSVKHGIPWVYGACVGMEGRAMAVRPGQTPCFRCVFPEPPAALELATCDTAGVLGAAAGVVASIQAALAIKQLVGDVGKFGSLVTVDLAAMRFGSVSLEGGRDTACPCCGKRAFQFLDRPADGSSATLCGREAVQLKGAGAMDLFQLAERWRSAGRLEVNRFFVRCRLVDPAEVVLTGFADGRVIVQGTKDVGRARALYARFVGA